MPLVFQIEKTAAEFARENLVLERNYQGYETDTHMIKQGDGVTHWNDLDYIDGTPPN